MQRLSLALAALVATAVAAAAPASASVISATTTVNVAKPVQLTKLQDMDFGTVILSGFTSTRQVVLSQAGVLTCGANLVCQGVPKTARFNIQGFNKLTATIAVSSTALSNGTDTIPFSADAPTTIYLPNSGAPGVDFNVGGTLTLTSALAGGTYSGTVTITADYQ